MKGIGSIYGIRYINKDNLKGGIQRLSKNGECAVIFFEMVDNKYVLPC